MKLSTFLKIPLFVFLAFSVNIPTSFAGESDAQLAVAFENQQSNLQIEGDGIVSKILPDDTNGSQHQRFILRLTNGQTLFSPQKKPSPGNSRANLICLSVNGEQECVF